jgi:hypothetical protein
MNCCVGDLAIVIRAEFSENLGKLVRVRAPLGWEWWGGFNEKVFVWEVAALSLAGAIRYLESDKTFEGGQYVLKPSLVGPSPDACLKPIRPSQFEAGRVLKECLEV